MENLLNRYFADSLSDTEKAELFQQIDNDKELKEEFARLQNIMALTGMADNEEDEALIKEKYNNIMQLADKRKLRRLSLSVIKYVAAAAFIIGIWFISKEYTLNSYSNDYTLIEAPKGQRVYVTFADGSEAWLSSRTKLKLSNQYNMKNRIVELDGEGFFSVSKNNDLPFIVKTHKHHIQATGTQFNVFSYSESDMFETDLIEGSVFVFNKEKEDIRLYLSPNEKAYNEAGQLQKSYYSFIQSQYIKNGIYSFENKSLKELARRLELWYNVKITIIKPETASYVFSGKFRQTDDIDNILRAVKETGKFDYRIIDENIIEIF